MSCRQRALVLAAFLVLGGLASPRDAAADEGGRSCGGGHRRPPAVIFDTDMDFDDSAALAYLCAEHHRGNIELRAVTIENDGAGIPGSAIRHARCILSACGLTSVPVADGGPTVGGHAVAPELQGAVEAVLEGAFASCTEGVQAGPMSAGELLTRTIRNTDDPIIIATGPLTNLAAVLRDEHGHGSHLAERIAQVVVMGGAFDVSGNLLGSGTESFDDTQEVNVWVDPAAFQTVLSAMRPELVSIVPLDATAFVPVTSAYVARLAADQHTAEAAIVLSIVTQPITQFGISLGAFYWWDPLAAIAATQPEHHVVDFRLERVSVVTDLTAASSGRTYVSRRGVPALVGVSANTTAFENIFLDGLNQRD